MRLEPEDEAIVAELMTRYDASSILDGIMTALTSRVSLDMRSKSPDLYAAYGKTLKVIGDAVDRLAALEEGPTP